MTMKKSITHIARTAACALTLALAALPAAAQDDQSFVHEQSAVEGYEWPTDKEVLHKLDTWRDQKFGVLMHWGLYSVPGIVESWSICSEDWIRRERFADYEKDKQWYWSQKDSLNPTKFNPDLWADIMKKAGMKYMIFTTKHHDGFCMFDSKYTDFSIAKGPFASNPRKNVAKEVFEAYRKQGFMIGCYFSKPDWHCKWFWNPYYATPTRMQNYKRKQHPDWWNNYVQYTKNQLSELTTDYGSLDILWLDGGWVAGEEVGLDSILVEARKRHPGLISVDRTIRGRNENYQTPEQGIPATQLNIPWESCITIGGGFAFGYEDVPKPLRTLVHLLIDVVGKGGNMALNIGAQPDGRLPLRATERALELGDWLHVHGSAIFETRALPPYFTKEWSFTQKPGARFALWRLPEGKTMGGSVEIPLRNVREAKLLGSGAEIQVETLENCAVLHIPESLRGESPIAPVFRLNAEDA